MSFQIPPFSWKNSSLNSNVLKTLASRGHLTHHPRPQRSGFEPGKWLWFCSEATLAFFQSQSSWNFISILQLEKKGKNLQLKCSNILWLSASPWPYPKTSNLSCVTRRHNLWFTSGPIWGWSLCFSVKIPKEYLNLTPHRFRTFVGWMIFTTLPKICRNFAVHGLWLWRGL